jgi:transcriptional regulator with XRE-family HTH domain
MDLNKLKLLSEITPEKISNAYKTNLIIKFMNIKLEQPNLSQNQICSKLGISSSTIKRIRQDLNVKSPYRYDIPLKTKKSKKVEITKDTEPLKEKKQTNKLKVKKIKEKTGNGSKSDEEIDSLIKGN